MSLVNFDDFYDICLCMMEPEEELVKRPKLKPRPGVEMLEVKKPIPTDDIPWWEKAVHEIERERREKESEEVYV